LDKKLPKKLPQLREIGGYICVYDFTAFWL
jgi:hypothetical protein